MPIEYKIAVAAVPASLVLILWGITIYLEKKKEKKTPEWRKLLYKISVKRGK